MEDFECVIGFQGVGNLSASCNLVENARSTSVFVLVLSRLYPVKKNIGFEIFRADRLGPFVSVGTKGQNNYSFPRSPLPSFPGTITFCWEAKCLLLQNDRTVSMSGPLFLLKSCLTPNCAQGPCSLVFHPNDIVFCKGSRFAYSQ